MRTLHNNELVAVGGGIVDPISTFAEICAAGILLVGVTAATIIGPELFLGYCLLIGIMTGGIVL